MLLALPINDMLKLLLMIFLSRSGDSMDGILDRDNNYIQNVRTPFSDGDSSNKKYFDDELSKSHLVSSHKNNAFKYLIEKMKVPYNTILW